MKNVKDERFVNRSLIYDGTNYDYYKTHMIAFLKFMDNKIWKPNINGWTSPKITTEDNTESVKVKRSWRTAEDEVALRNYRLLMPYIME